MPGQSSAIRTPRTRTDVHPSCASFVDIPPTKAGRHSHAVLRDLSAAVGSRLENTNLFKRLDNVALNTGGRVAVVGRAGTPAVGGTVQLGERSDTDRLAEVDVAGDGSCVLLVLNFQACVWRAAGLPADAFTPDRPGCRSQLAAEILSIRVP